MFWLHNFAYDDARFFEDVDHVIVPSEFSRRWYRERLGLECRVLPYVIDPRRVSGEKRVSGEWLVVSGQERVSGEGSVVSGQSEEEVIVEGSAARRSTLDAQRFVTFVNPQPTKGLFVFARIAEQLQRRRPDIPILVVESRGNAEWLEQVPIDLSWCQNLHAMANTYDPRDFYRVTKLMLVPSLWNESFGLVAAESMLNGIPVLASDRGALPEIVSGEASVVSGEGRRGQWSKVRGQLSGADATESGGFLFHIPERYGPETTVVPTVEEVEPWLEAIIRLWDDENLYRECSEKAKAHARRWHPDVLGPMYAEFFGALSVESRALSVRAKNSTEIQIANRRSEISNPQSYTHLNAQRSTLNASAGLTSIIIVTHNQLEFTRLCVASIQQYTTEPYELILVDNGSTDGTVDYLKSLGRETELLADLSTPLRRVTVLVNVENRGFPAAANQGIQASNGQQIVLLNNDTVVTAHWLTRMLRALRSDATVGMIGPVSNFVSGPQQIEVPYVGQGSRAEGLGPVGKDDCDFAKLDEFACAWSQANSGQVQQVDRLVGFCLLITREVIDRIGLFDERFGIGNFEDDDYCRRAREAGFTLVIARDAFVHHFGGATFQASDIDFGALMQANERIFREKWGSPAPGGPNSIAATRAAATEGRHSPGAVISATPVTTNHSSSDPNPQRSTLNSPSA